MLTLPGKAFLMRAGTIVDATIITAPSSTKNEGKARDPEMHQTKKGKAWHFGMKAHIGVDAQSGIVHTVIATSANVHDVTQAGALLHGHETAAYGDAGYRGVHKREEAQCTFQRVHGTSPASVQMHQCAGPFREVRMRAEERFDLASSRRTQTRNAGPPTTPARHAHREIGEVGASNRRAKSSRCRERAKAASSRRMAVITDLDDWPGTLEAPRYCSTASREQSRVPCAQAGEGSRAWEALDVALARLRGFHVRSMATNRSPRILTAERNRLLTAQLLGVLISTAR